MSGYQSDVNFENLRVIGDLPVENTLGGFGITTGLTDDYELTLDPPITRYRKGLPLKVRFNHANTGLVRINVDEQGLVPVMKIVDGALVDILPGELNTIRIYNLINDGASFQVITGTEATVPEGNTGTPGILELATLEEGLLGEDMTKAVTSHTVMQIISDKVTGLWEDKGLLDAEDSPLFPAGEKGDAYTIVLDPGEEGFIGQLDGDADDPGVQVSNRDVLYCVNDNPGGSAFEVGDDWNVIQSNLERATTELAGILRIATDEEIENGFNVTAAVTPPGLKNYLNDLSASELVRGLAKIASQNLTDLGQDDSTIVTPLKLRIRIAGLIASNIETQEGIINNKFVTPGGLKTFFDAQPFGNPEPNLGNPTTNGLVLASQTDGTRSWIETTRLLFKNLGTASEGNNPGLGEVPISPTYIVPAGLLTGQQGLRIRMNGFFRRALTSGAVSVEKTLRVYFGNQVVLTNNNVSNPEGVWTIEIIAYRATDGIIKGWGALHIDGFPSEVSSIQTANLGVGLGFPIELTAQNPAGDSGQGSLVNRFSFIVEKLT